MESLNEVTDALENLNVRDKSVKVIQFGAKMLLGYFQSNASKETLDILRNVNLTCANGRKVFRLLKSLKFISNILKIITKVAWTTSEYDYESFLTLFQQIAWVTFDLRYG